MTKIMSAIISRFPDRGPGFYTAGLGLSADRDAAGMRGVQWHQPDLAPAQISVEVLLGRRDEVVEVEVEPLDAVGLPGCAVCHECPREWKTSGC